ncbi:MAG: thioesterase family protein [Deltaproteobacteria bacterium]|nr:thioesterase family protein [Deltaproteobacteria bacterium]
MDELSPKDFAVDYRVAWSDLDVNAHMRNTAYLDYCGDVRLRFFDHFGFSLSYFQQQGIGPVVLRDEVDYLRELRALEHVRVRLLLAGLSADRRRYRFRNEFVRDDGKLAARVTSTAVWLEQRQRKVVVPPQAMIDLICALARSEDFAELEDRPV